MTQTRIALRTLRAAAIAALFALLLNGCTPLEALAVLRAQVVSLTPAPLKPSNSALLLQLLDAARLRIVQGQAGAAASLIRSFDSYVAKFQAAGILTSGQAGNLQNASDTVKGLLVVAPTLDSGLQLLWRFDEITGTTAQDISANGNTGTLVNGPAWTAGQLNGGLAFDGVSFQYVTAGVRPSLKMTNAITISAWVRQTNNGQSGIIVNKEGEYEIAFQGGTIQYALANTGGNWFWVDTGYALPFDDWHHITLTYSTADGARFYRDGTQVFSAALPNAPIGDTDTFNNEFRVGSRSFPQDFQGIIDEVRVYNRALTAAEVSAVADPLGNLGP